MPSSMSDRLLTKNWLKWLLTFLFWTLLGLSFASQLYLTQSKLGYPVTWKFALGNALADWYVFAILSVPALWLSRRFRFERAQWRSSLATHLVASALFSVCWVVVRVWAEEL